MKGLRQWFQRRLNRPRNEQTEFAPDRDFHRRLRALDATGRTTGFYSISVAYNLLTSDRICYELETFQNFVIAKGSDAWLSFRRELNELQVTACRVWQRTNATKSPHELKHLTIELKALVEYTSVVERILSSLEQVQAEREQHLADTTS